MLESGEVKALPEELEKMQRPRKKKSSSKEASPKVNQTIKIIEEIEPEFTFQPDEKDSSTQSEDEEPTINQVVKIRFVSQKLKDFEASGKDLKSIPFFDVKQEDESSDVEFEIITYLDNDLALKPTQQSLESHQQTTEKVQPIVNQNQKPNEVLNQDEASFEDLPMPIEDQQPVLDNQKLIQIEQTHKVEESHKAEENKIVKNEIPENSIIQANTLQTIEEKHEESTTLKWSPRMKEPWKTLKPHQIERLKNKAKERSFQYESSKILNSNIDHPLNLILFSVPTDSNKTALYINSVRDHLVRSDQVQKDNLLKEYFRASSESDGYRKFVDYVIQTTPK
ncbi:hypothetical protein TRFO_13281 [Tritrichomonas foetus]|uniref:Uncharacterized protein n=1 Tax=Tritrichomonas foetus TaxID=1144522 RepID=A0A1J4L2S7_9EUKA|nr:hypothetical protein TRFO_13281 [Tritrichomonas foetus]|eukprot:OHT16276.1 hypothetical protein TRFO_13281 [Tritrichomonas foetus]